MFLNYKIKANTITFWCTDIDVNEKTVAALLEDFFLDMSKERKIFLYGNQLSDGYTVKLLDPLVILKKAQSLTDPFQTFYYLSEAKIKSNYFQYASSVTIYYFENEVEWLDFLATSVIEKPRKLIKKGILSARFSSVNHGTDFWFECNKVHEKRVLQLLEDISNLGYNVKRVFKSPRKTKKMFYC